MWSLPNRTSSSTSPPLRTISPLDLTPLVSKDIVDKFVPGSLDPCYTTDKKLICLRNDLAPNVLWYNKKLMDEFGYTIPTTWEEYIALSDKVAKEHPGYVMGSCRRRRSIVLLAERLPDREAPQPV